MTDDTDHGHDSRNGAEEPTQPDGSGDKSPVPPTWIGWSFRIFSATLIAALFVYLLSHATAPDRDFRLQTEADWSKASTRDGTLLVPVTLTNDSTQTIRNLKVELMSASSEPIEVEVMLFGPGERVTYVVPLEERGEISHRVLSFEQ